MGFWRDEFSKDEISFLLGKVKEFRIFSDEGRVSLRGAGNSDGWTAVLVSATNLEIKSDALKSRILRGVLFSSDLLENFSERDFKKVTYNLRNRFEKDEIKAHKVVFPIWGLPTFLQGTKKIGDVTLNFSPSQKTSLFKKIMSEREGQRKDRQFEGFFTKEKMVDLRGCSACFAHVKANSPADANERASEALYQVLGMINLAKDGGKYWRSSSRVRGKLPISDVLIGPQTTTHDELGKLTHDGFWHENWVGGPTQKALSPENKKGWEGRYLQLMGAISKSPWEQKCRSAAARYFKAFSNPNLEESFLDGWRLFENVSGSRYEKVEDQLRRASNIFEDNIEYLIIGRHLALRRNLLAHGHPIRSDDDETIAFQMLQFVAPFLERYILNWSAFSSQQELWEFLDLPAAKSERASERKLLLRRMDLLAKAAKFRGEDS